MDQAREDSLSTQHIATDVHDRECAKHVWAAAKPMLVPGYKQRKERRKQRAKFVS